MESEDRQWEPTSILSLTGASLRTRFKSLRDCDRQCQVCDVWNARRQFSTCTKRPSYHVQYEGEEWIKFNSDTGEATTALLVELAEGVRLRKVCELRMVSTFPTSVEPSFRRWTSLATSTRWKDMLLKDTSHLHLQVHSACTTRSSSRSVR